MTLWEIIKKYFYFVLQRKWYYFGAMFFLGLGTAMGRLVPLIYGEIVAYVSESALGYVGFLVGLLLIIRLGSSFMHLIKDILIDVVVAHIIQAAKVEYVTALQNVDYEYHTNKSSGSLISLAKRGEAALVTAFMDINNSALIKLLSFVFTVIIMFTISVQIALIMIAVIVATVFFGTFFVKRNIRFRKQVNEREDNISAVVVDNMIGFETVKIFAQEKWENKRLNETYVPWRVAIFNYFKTFREIDLNLAIMTTIGYGAVFAFAINGIQTGQLTLSTFVAAMVYVFDVSNSLHEMIYNLRNLGKTQTDLVKYFDTMGLQTNISEKADATGLREVKGEIEFEDVSFKYANSDLVLKHINLNVRPDETIALVGFSGSGKTTLTKLLMRFYDVTSGAIKIDGHDIRDSKLKDLRKAIGLVPQEPIMFNDSIAYNISYGKIGASQEEIIHAAKQANLAEFIETLADGYETRVGERGIKLSGGQKQRLAIARVMLENPEIVIFDEATSQLDSANEKKIQSAFDNLTKNKTTIVIAHRLSTIMHADRIIVFNEGEIVEKGKHEDLLANEGIYHQLWSLQTDEIE
jgi:ATP-binding cassette subfamily B protein